MHALLVHGWKGWPDNAWFPWLKQELGARGYEIDAPQLPDPWLPDREIWAGIIREKFMSPDLTVVAHSLGVPATLFALQAYDGPPVDHVVCVAGFMRPFVFPGVSQWFGNATINVGRIKGKVKRWSVVHAKNDPLVPYREGEYLADQLGVPIVSNTKFHMNQATACYELPEVLEGVVGANGGDRGEGSGVKDEERP